MAGTGFLLPAGSVKKDVRGENQLEVTAGELASLKRSSNRTFRRAMVEKLDFGDFVGSDFVSVWKLRSLKMRRESFADFVDVVDPRLRIQLGMKLN